LLGQSLAADRYEILLVDDGSTDGTGVDIDRWARAHPQRVRVFHEPHSGWPGRPRNIGIDMARGDYIQFVDSDDALTPVALERVLAAARESDADVVLPKSASDFRGVNHDLYRRNQRRVGWLDFPLVESLVPHKLIRRAFALEHGLRFADEPRHVEDQLFFVHAYAHAGSVAVVADEVCYLFRRRRGFGRNLGDVPADPDDYYRDLEGVLDVIDRHVTDAVQRLRLYERFYRVEILGRLRDRPMLDYDADYRRRLYHRIRRLVDERMPPELDGLLPAFVRDQARLVRDHNLPALVRHAETLSTLAVQASIGAVDWRGGALAFDFHAPVTLDGEPLDYQPVDGDFADVVVVSREDASTWFVPPTLPVVAAEGGLAVQGRVDIDLRHVCGGRALLPGLWDVRLRVRIGGLTRTARLNAPDPAPAPPLCLYDEPPRAVLPYWTDAGGLALDVDGWSHPVSEQAVAGATPTERGWVLPGLVASAPMKRSVAVLLQSPDGAVAHHDGRLHLDPAGATLDRPRQPRRSEDCRAWLRLGAPGEDAASPLP